MSNVRISLETAEFLASGRLGEMMTDFYELKEKYTLHDAIIQCQYCGVYGVDNFNCPQCGAPIKWEGWNSNE